MSPNGIYSGFDRIFISSSSESSDSESLLLEDIKTDGNQINKQWEAIERTLYQEPGQQVTDPELLKECKLWRETFPHFRVKGTKIDIRKTDNKLAEVNKSLETLKNNFNLQKLEEKRESIKKKVVGELVERIIAKYGISKDESANPVAQKQSRNEVKISLIEDDHSEKAPNNISKSFNINSNLSLSTTDSECYFERGKHSANEDDCMTAEQVQKNLYDIFDSWEKDCKNNAKVQKNFNSHKINNSYVKENPTAKFSGKSTAGKFKPKKFTPPSDSLPDVIKPFEMTQKIDKKYKGLIEKIVERKHYELDEMRHCPESASNLDIMNYEETLKKIRRASGFDDYLNRKEMPKINKFNNNWLKRSEISCYSTGDNPLSENARTVKEKLPENLRSENRQTESGKALLEELKRETALNSRRPVRKSDIVEEISLRRPKPFTFALEKKKTFNSKDFIKKNKKETKAKQQQQNDVGATKSELNFKKRLNSNDLSNNKGKNSNGNENSLPPIETAQQTHVGSGRPFVYEWQNSHCRVINNETQQTGRTTFGAVAVEQMNTFRRVTNDNKVQPDELAAKLLQSMNY